jgi:transposase-like protein
MVAFPEKARKEKDLYSGQNPRTDPKERTKTRVEGMQKALMMEEREIYLGPHPTKANGFSPRGLLTLAILVLYAFRVSTRKISALWKDLRLWVTPKISP